MAGFEVVVRPAIFPDIRPRPRPALPPPDDPTKGFAVIQGNPAGSTSNSYSLAINASYSRPVEKERRVDKVRIHQIEDGDGGGGGGGGGGTINEDNYVDVEVPTRITMNEGGGHTGPDEGGGHTGPDEGGGHTGPDEGGAVPIYRKYFYQRTPEAANIEILLRDQIRKAPR